jgi:hypothetical protein
MPAYFETEFHQQGRSLMREKHCAVESQNVVEDAAGQQELKERFARSGRGHVPLRKIRNIVERLGIVVYTSTDEHD